MSLPDPKTRREVYLNSIANGESVDLTPRTREEVYLDAIANNGGGSGGGTTVVANPELAGTEDALTGLQVGDTKYKVGGSGGGVLVVHDNNGTLDKTWQEIYDAAPSVTIVINEDGMLTILPVFGIVEGDASYLVICGVLGQGSIEPKMYIATSANSYPVHS